MINGIKLEIKFLKKILMQNDFIKLFPCKLIKEFVKLCLSFALISPIYINQFTGGSNP